MVKWKIYNPKTNAEVSFELNPSDGGAPERNRTMNYMARSGPNAGTIVFQGQEEVHKFTISGTILWEEQVEFFNNLFDLNHQVKLTDDLGREKWVYFTRFSMERMRKASHPWAHRYTMEYVEIEL